MGRFGLLPWEFAARGPRPCLTPPELGAVADRALAAKPGYGATALRRPSVTVSQHNEHGIGLVQCSTGISEADAADDGSLHPLPSP